WLQAPVVEPKAGKGEPNTVRRAQSGTPQGGVISPLLSNLYLHQFDRSFYHLQGRHAKPEPSWCATPMTLWCWPATWVSGWNTGSNKASSRAWDLASIATRRALCALTKDRPWTFWAIRLST